MKKYFGKLCLGGVLLFSLSMSLTSCDPYLDDILGEWSRPTPGGGSSSDETTPTMKATPLTFEVLTDGTITVTNPKGDMYYKINDGAKVDLTAGVSATIDVTKDDKVEFYGTATSYYGTTFGGTADMKVYGNIMSLLSPTGFADNKTLTANGTFGQLFFSYTNLKDASNLFLPAETLTSNCYAFMFSSCSNLTTAPALPAETLTEACYYEMFSGCSSLTTAPALPAETLKGYCYYGMFAGCSSLTTAPKLPAPTLANFCYHGMFYGCTGLKDAYVKAAFVNTNDECTDMFNGCTAIGAKLHTTSDHKASWDNMMGSTKTWSTWTAVDDWTD